MSARVLIIDIDETNTTYLANEFNKAGYQSFTATNGTKGLAIALREQPHIIVLDPTFTDIGIDEFIEEIRGDQRTSHSKIIAFSSLIELDEVQAAIDLGFDEYMAKESDAMPFLFDTVHFFLVELGKYEEASEVGEKPEIPLNENTGKVIVFSSAKGGIGTSSLCVNLAAIMHQIENGAKIAVLDLVLPIGSLATIVGQENGKNIVSISNLPTTQITSQLIKDYLPLNNVWNFHLIAGSENPEQANNLDITKIPTILSVLKHNFDYTFIDLGKSLSRIALPIILSCELLVHVLSLDSAAVSLSLLVKDYLREKGINEKQFYALINNAAPVEGIPKIEVDEMLGGEITRSIPYMGRNFDIANNLHIPISTKFPDDVVTIGLQQIMDDIRQKLMLSERAYG